MKLLVLLVALTSLAFGSEIPHQQKTQRHCKLKTKNVFSEVLPDKDSAGTNCQLRNTRSTTARKKTSNGAKVGPASVVLPLVFTSVFSAIFNLPPNAPESRLVVTDTFAKQINGTVPAKRAPRNHTQ